MDDFQYSQPGGRVLRWLRRGVLPVARARDGWHHVEYGPRFRILVGAAWMLAAFAGGLAILLPDDRPGSGLLARAMVIAMFLVPAVAAQMAWVNFALRFDDGGLQIRDRWLRWGRLPWSDVQSVQISGTVDGWTMLLRNRPAVEISNWMSGHQSLLDAVGQQTAPDESPVQ